MRTAYHFMPTFCLLGLLAVPVATAGAEKNAPTTRQASTAPGRSSASSARGTVSSSPSRMRSASVRMRGTSARRVVSLDDVVDGGTYFEDPKTGQLIQTNELPGGVAQASAIAAEPPQATKAVPAEPAIVPDAVDAGFMLAEDGCCADGSCGTCDACLVPCGVGLPAGTLELFAGVQGFTGPANHPDSNGSGSFGFNEGVNWGLPIPGFGCLGAQVGYRATQSNLSGSAFSRDARDQGFLTAGLFRRVDYGLQGGVVMDYLSEAWYRDVNLTNIRAELSWVFDCTHELGFWMTAGTEDEVIPPATTAESQEIWEPTDLYACFYRYQFDGCRDGDARLFAGWTGHGDGLIGLDAHMPVGDAWALQTNLAYLIPKEGEGSGPNAGHAQESWNIGINLVWYPGRYLGHCEDSYYRPLFRVADNGVFMMDRR